MLQGSHHCCELRIVFCCDGYCESVWRLYIQWYHL